MGTVTVYFEDPVHEQTKNGDRSSCPASGCSSASVGQRMGHVKQDKQDFLRVSSPPLVCPKNYASAG
jgi:hypothetical protein